MTLLIYIVGRAFSGAFTPVNIQLGFKVAGIFRFDHDIFSNLEFSPSDLIDRLVPSANTDNFIQLKHKQSFDQQHQVLESPLLSKNLLSVSAFPFNQGLPQWIMLFHSALFLAFVSFALTSFISSFTTSRNLFFGLPLFLFLGNSIFMTLFPTYSWSLLMTCSYHLNLPYLIFISNHSTLTLLLMSNTLCHNFITFVGSMVEWLECRDCNRHGLGTKSTRAILLCPWERHFTALSPAWWSWQAVLNFSYIFIEFSVDSNILSSLEAGWGNCLPYVLEPLSLSYESGG